MAGPVFAGRLAVFTTCNRARLGMARAVLASVRTHYPQAALFICLVDAMDGVAPLVGGQIVSAHDIDVPEWPALCMRMDAMGLCCVLKPFMMLNLLDRRFDAVVHFDSDIALFGRIDSALDLLAAGAALVLTPHLLSPPGPGMLPDALAILMAGVFNAGFFAARDAISARAALQWWAEQVHRDCRAAPQQGMTWDQRWFDLLPGMFDDVAVSRDAGLNVAYWNVAQRGLVRTAAGWRVNGAPLGFFHFSGYSPAQPTRLTHYSWTQLPALAAPVADLLAEYAALLAAHAVPAEASLPYAYGNFASGIPIPPAVRAMFADDHAMAEPDPFAHYEAHVNAPFRVTPRHPGGYVATNLIAYLVRTDPQIGARVDLLTTEGVRAAVRRAAACGAISGPFLAAATPGLDAAARAALRHADADAPDCGAVSDLTLRHNALLRSTSWRITAPLRALATGLRRLVGPSR